MLVVNKNLKSKDIRGKKYRSPAFSISAIFSVPFLALAILTCASIPPREGRGVIIGLIFVVLLALPIAEMISFREISYIMCKDKLYFLVHKLHILRIKTERKCAVLERTAVLTILILKIFDMLVLNSRAIIRDIEDLYLRES